VAKVWLPHGSVLLPSLPLSLPLYHFLNLHFNVISLFSTLVLLNFYQGWVSIKHSLETPQCWMSMWKRNLIFAQSRSLPYSSSTSEKSSNSISDQFTSWICTSSCTKKWGFIPDCKLQWPRNGTNPSSNAHRRLDSGTEEDRKYAKWLHAVGHGTINDAQGQIKPDTVMRCGDTLEPLIRNLSCMEPVPTSVKWWVVSRMYNSLPKKWHCRCPQL